MENAVATADRFAKRLPACFFAQRSIFANHGMKIDALAQARLLNHHSGSSTWPPPQQNIGDRAAALAAGRWMLRACCPAARDGTAVVPGRQVPSSIPSACRRCPCACSCRMLSSWLGVMNATSAGVTRLMLLAFTRGASLAAELGRSDRLVEGRAFSPSTESRPPALARSERLVVGRPPFSSTDSLAWGASRDAGLAIRRSWFCIDAAAPLPCAAARLSSNSWAAKAVLGRSAPAFSLLARNFAATEPDTEPGSLVDAGLEIAP